MAEAGTYTGSCHCGAVRYEVETGFEPIISCNCSICRKRGSVLTFVPLGQFRLVSGEDALTDYQFNHKVVHHLFCRTCGVASFGRGTTPDGSEMVGINIRCLDGVDLDSLPITKFDGASL